MGTWDSFVERAAGWARADGRRPWLALVAVGAVAGVLAGLGAVAMGGAGGTHAVEASLPRAVRVTTTTAAAPPLVVYVAGAVHRPGVLEVAEGARVADAVAAAGGATPVADLGRVNLAERVADGSRLYIPVVDEVPPAPVAPVVAGGAGGATPAAPVDLNHATEDQLDDLPGVGPATAAAIVAHRREHGPFQAVDDLLQVRGIGPAKLDGLRDQVRV